MIGVGGHWENEEELGADALLAEVRGPAVVAVRAAAIYFSSEVKRTLTGRRTGRAYVLGSRVHIASAPGEPPAVLYGNLRNSVGYSEPRWEGLVVTSEVGPGLGQAPAAGAPDPAKSYARRLELGGVDSRGVRILPRPYMEPTALRVAPVIEAMLKREVS